MTEMFQGLIIVFPYKISSDDGFIRIMTAGIEQSLNRIKFFILVSLMIYKVLTVMNFHECSH